MNNKIIMVICLMLLVISSAFAYEDYQESVIPTTTMERYTTWDRITDFFKGESFSTAEIASTSRIYRAGGEYFEIRYQFKCQQNADNGLLKIAVNGPTDSDIVYTDTHGPCIKDRYYVLTSTGIKYPEKFADDCGESHWIYVKHEIQTALGQSYITDTEGNTNDGYEIVGNIVTSCEASPCEGLSGDATGSEYCKDGQVVQRYYNTFNQVINGECTTTIKTNDNCGTLGCEDATCNEIIKGYELIEDACYIATYISNEREPSNFYSSKSDCEDEITPEESVTVYLVEGDVCISKTVLISDKPANSYVDEARCEAALPVEEEVFIDDVDDTVEDNTTIDDTADDTADDTEDDATRDSEANDSPEDKVGFWKSIWNWFARLFGADV